MSSPAQLDVDRLREKFPRTHKALIAVFPFAPWNEMLKVIEQSMHEQKIASVIAGRLSILRGLDRSTRRWIVLSIAADRKEILHRQQKSFLTKLFERSLDDILAELREIETCRQEGRATPDAPIDDRPRGFMFISHCRGSEGDLAEALTDQLEKLHCYCWVAPRDIPDGADWNKEVYGAAQRCDAMVLLYSTKAASNKHVQGEVHIAIARGVPVFVVKLAEGDPAKINIGLASYQHIDWTTRGALASVVELAQRLKSQFAAKQAA